MRRAPSLSYDTPDPDASGLESFDDYYVFSGGLDRYRYSLLGKREMYVPYNNNRLLNLPTGRTLTEGLDIFNSVADIPGVTFGVHVCKGNNMSQWIGSGGYDFTAALSRPEAARGLAATSAAPALIGRRLRARSLGSRPHTQTGKSGGQTQPRSSSRK